MKNTVSVAVLILASHCLPAFGSEPAANSKVTPPPKAPPAAVVVQECAPGASRSLVHRFWHKKYYNPASALPFIADNTRYEPHLRDIRLLRLDHKSLPGRDAGIQETMPVLPYYKDGYFQLPVR
jgi:hypothetical protein